MSVAMVLAGMTFAEAGCALEWQLFDSEGRPIEGGTGARDDVSVWDLPAAVALPDGSFALPAGAFRQRLRGLELLRLSSYVRHERMRGGPGTMKR